MKITHSFPALDATSFRALESVLLDRFDYPPLPDAYKDFLLRHNGGYIEPGWGDGSKEPTHQVVFDTPLRWARANNDLVKPSLVSFFGAWMPECMNEDEVADWNLLELIASNEHSKHDFDVLPDKMMSIAKCSHPHAADMLCLGLDSRDFGKVYYFYGLVFHPGRFHGDYYDNKRQQILEQYAIRTEEDIDPNTQAGSDVMFALNRVEFVKVAESFDAFLTGCRIEAQPH